MQERAANLGYDWPSIDGVLDKVREEVGELVEAEDDAHRAEELGDLLFVLVNVGRKTGIEVEGALRAANEKFRGRFRHVELSAAARRRRAARPVVRGAGRALGRREGGRARGGEGMSIGNRPPGDGGIGNRAASGRRATPARPAPDRDHARGPEVGRGVVHDPLRRHPGAVRRDDRGPRPAAPPRQGHGLGHRHLRDAAARDRGALRARGREGQDRRPDPRDPAAGRALAARRRGPDPARGADRHRRLRRHRRRRRHADRVDHRRLRRPRGRAHHLRDGPPPGRSRRRRVGRDHRRHHGCSTSTTPRTRGPRSTSTSSGTDAGAYVELQGTAEGKPFDRAALDELLDLAGAGLARLFEAQTAALATVRR